MHPTHVLFFEMLEDIRTELKELKEELNEKKIE